jgi:hypothetical protein
VKLSKRQFAIKIERDEEMFTSPFYSRSFSHAASVPDPFPKLKPEKACRIFSTWPGVFVG